MSKKQVALYQEDPASSNSIFNIQWAVVVGETPQELAKKIADKFYRSPLREFLREVEDYGDDLTIDDLNDIAYDLLGEDYSVAEVK